MAKKTRRPNIPEQTLERARRQVGQEVVEPAASADPVQPVVAAAVVKRRALSSADLRAEYAYVAADLRNMGVLAGAFLAVLIALSFFI